MLKKCIFILALIVADITYAANNPSAGKLFYDQKNPKEFTIALEANPSTGYTWKIINQPKEVKLLKHEFVAPKDKKLVGTPGNDIWHFKLNSDKPVKLTFVYQRSWEKKVKPAKEVVVEVGK
jgi:predicted secreted protein